MLVLAFVLPTLVFAASGRASPSKTKIENLNIKTSPVINQVFNYQVTANQLLLNERVPAVGIVNTEVKTIDLLKAVRPAKSLYLNLRQSGKDDIGWQSSLNSNYKNKTTGYPILLKLEIRT